MGIQIRAIIFFSFVFAVTLQSHADQMSPFDRCMLDANGRGVPAQNACLGLEGDPCPRGAINARCDMPPAEPISNNLNDSPAGSITPAPEDGGRAHCARTCAFACVQKNEQWNCPDHDPNKSEPTVQKPPEPTPEELAQRCVNENSDAIDTCTSKQSSADNTCNADKNAGMSGATDLAAGLALAMGQMTSSGVQAACGNMAGISQGSNAALASYRTSCNSSKNNCTSACSSAKSKLDQCAKKATNASDVQRALADNSDYKSITSAASQCKALQTKVDQADQAIKNIAQTQLNAQNCQQATSAMSSIPVVAAGQDCSNPAFAASNQVCICQANPRAPGCGLDQSSGVPPSGLSSVGDYNSSAGGAGLDNLPGLTNDTNLADLKAQQAAAAEDVGGKKGNGAPIGSGSVFDGNGSGSNGGAKGTDYSKYKGTSGFYGTPSSGGGGGTTGTYRGGGNAQNSGSPSAYGKPQGPDLRQFLPGGANDPHRGIAGTTGPDGITGPNSNIWEKVQNRYRNITPSLL